ncbi:MAG: hypothetical protein PHW73_15200 [Atribacterota bacterium]|nr:hypothetical protein [Atribacterota bacterium]
MNINIYGRILIALQGLSVLLAPFVIGKDRGKYTWSNFIGSLIGLILLLLALGLKISFSY